MPQDFFGYTRQNPGQFILSSDFASIYFANGHRRTTPSDRLGLVQSAACSYQHRVEPRFEAGSSEMYWLTGQPSGSIQCGRLVGDKGFLHGVRVNSARGQFGNSNLVAENGVLGTIEFKAGKTQVAQDVMTLGGCVLQGVAFSTSSGSLEIAEALTISVAILIPKNLATR